MEAVDNNLMRESDKRMPLNNPFVDRRMAEAFPHKYGGKDSPVTNVQENVVNSSRGVRSGTGKGRTVKLTPSEVAIAKRLGVPLEEYAKHVKR